jgi:HrpA-like RNA helicase
MEEEAGDVLVFLPGQSDIDDIQVSRFVAGVSFH